LARNKKNSKLIPFLQGGIFCSNLIEKISSFKNCPYGQFLKLCRNLLSYLVIFFIQVNRRAVLKIIKSPSDFTWGLFRSGAIIIFPQRNLLSMIGNLLGRNV